MQAAMSLQAKLQTAQGNADEGASAPIVDIVLLVGAVIIIIFIIGVAKTPISNWITSVFSKVGNIS